MESTPIHRCRLVGNDSEFVDLQLRILVVAAPHGLASRNRARSFAMLLALGFLTSSACSENSPTESNATTSPSQEVEDSALPPPSAGGGELVVVSIFNLERLAVVSGEEGRVLHEAFEALVARCMADRGFTYPKASYAGSNSEALNQIYPSDEELDNFGYAWRSHQAGIVAPATPGEQIEDSAFQAALSGTPADAGCGVAASERMNSNDLLFAQQVFFDANEEISTKAVTEARYVQAAQQWRQCVNQGGLDFADTDAGPRRFAGDITPDSLSVAKIDFTCRRASRIEEIRIELVAESSRAWVEAHPEAHQDLLAAKQAAVARAASILQGEN